MNAQFRSSRYSEIKLFSKLELQKAITMTTSQARPTVACSGPQGNQTFITRIPAHTNALCFPAFRTCQTWLTIASLRIQLDRSYMMYGLQTQTVFSSLPVEQFHVVQKCHLKWSSCFNFAFQWSFVFMLKASFGRF